MKRRIIVLRHAKSAWDSDAATDHERPLNKRGRRDAPRVAERLAELDWVPQRVLSSDATRTRQTWERMVDAFEPAPEVRFTRSLYHAGWSEVRALLGELKDSVATAMVIGHNPGWEEVVQALSGQSTGMTTCNAALLSVKADSWAKALECVGSWQLEEVLRPKEI